MSNLALLIEQASKALPFLSKQDQEALLSLLEEEAKRPIFVPNDGSPQSKFIHDPSKRKVLLGTRRSGKSYLLGLYLFKEAFEHPNSRCLYIGLTRESAKRIMWLDVLHPIAEAFNIKATFNKSDLVITLTNGSTIEVLGLDANESEMRKVFGRKYLLAAADEAALYTINLRQLVYEVLGPAMIDNNGTIILAGMPSDIHSGMFYDLTNGQDSSDPGQWSQVDMDSEGNTFDTWSCHRWCASQNPRMKELFEAEITKMISESPGIEQSPWFLQGYRGRWAVNQSNLVYSYQSGRNDYQQLPVFYSGNHYILGVDLGWSDATSFIVSMWNDQDPTLYFIECFEQTKMDLLDVAEKIKEYESKYKFDKKVVDGANKQFVESLRKRLGINLTPADKREKWEHQQLMNADFVAGKIKLSPKCSNLATCYGKIIRDPKSDIPRESMSCHRWSHIPDAALYSYFYAYTYLSKRPEQGPVLYSPEWYKKEESRMRETVSNEVRQEKYSHTEAPGRYIDDSF